MTEGSENITIKDSVITTSTKTTDGFVSIATTTTTNELPAEVQDEIISCSLVASKDTLVIANGTFSWHEHVYRKLTNKPTPHYIENILGLQNVSVDSDNRNMTIRNLSPNRQQTDLKPVNTMLHHDLNEPLNLSVRNEGKVRLKATNSSATTITTTTKG